MENDIPTVNRVDEIHDRLVAIQGERVRVRANLGRGRVVECIGTLLQAHPALFVIEAEGRRGSVARQSYQYVDVLTGTVELFDPKTGKNVLDSSSQG